LIGVGVVVLAIGAGGALLPIEEEFSDFGLGRTGLVTIECGTAFSDDVRISGDPSISIFDPVFIEGDNDDESATTFCERKRSSSRLIALLGLIGGAVVLLAGLFWPSAKPAAPARPQSTPPPQQRPAAGGSQPPRPTPQPAQAPNRPSPGSTEDAWWSQPVEAAQPVVAPLPRRGDGPLVDPSFPAAPAAPIPDSVVGSLPSAPVSGRFGPVVDPTPAAAAAPIPDAVVGEYRGPAESSNVESQTADVDPTRPAEATVVEQVEHVQLGDGRVLLVHDVSVVGRSPAPPASYPTAVLVTVADRTVSKSHAAFGRTGGKLWVEDLHSRNGLIVTRANGTRHPSTPGEVVPLAAGDSVRLGLDTTMTVRTGPPDTNEPTQVRQR